MCLKKADRFKNFMKGSYMETGANEKMAAPEVEKNLY